MTFELPGAAGLLGPARYGPYLSACGGRSDVALRLYEWNADLAGAFWVDLGLLEIPLRNALDQALRRRHEGLHRPGDWLEDPAGELGRDRRGPGRHVQPYQDIAAARRRVQDNRKPLDRDQIISETPFGLWHQLVSDRQRFLWPDLASAFPAAPSRNHRHVREPVSALRHFRNRIAHHHRIWPHDCQARHTDLLTLAGYIDPHLGTWIATRSHVPTLLATRPPHTYPAQ